MSAGGSEGRECGWGGSREEEELGCQEHGGRRQSNRAGARAGARTFGIVEDGVVECELYIGTELREGGVFAVGQLVLVFVGISVFWFLDTAGRVRGAAGR